jgi:translation initiation factor RLI1
MKREELIAWPGMGKQLGRFSLKVNEGRLDKKVVVRCAGRKCNRKDQLCQDACRGN